MGAMGDVSPSSDIDTVFFAVHCPAHWLHCIIGAPSIILETGLAVTTCTIGINEKRKGKIEVLGFKQGFSGWAFDTFVLPILQQKQVYFRNKKINDKLNKLTKTPRKLKKYK